MSAPAKTIIIGGGLSGLCLAQALQRTGGEVIVYERDRSADIRGQGYRLTIDEIGSDALRTCLPAKTYDFIRSTSSASSRVG
jgi:2-polyprenyl-6-methoxyphenol hydroxylase-like FAD-dependent oxidoreductase